jgi:hypothetical protein
VAKDSEEGKAEREEEKAGYLIGSLCILYGRHAVRIHKIP